MKRIISTALILGIIHVNYIQAREYRTPLSLQFGYWHTPVEDQLEINQENDWDVDTWAAGYAQNAHRSFDKCHTNAHAVPLAQIFFDQSTFPAADIFANSTVPSQASNTALTFAILSPKVEYNEEGVMFGMNVTKRYRDDRLRVGLRVNMPYRVVEMHNDFKEEDQSNVTSINDVIVNQSDLFPPVPGLSTQETVVDNDWAYRLDFLTGLCSASCTIPLVQYRTPSNANPTTIAGVDVTETGNLSPDVALGAGNPVNMIQVTPGSRPTGTLATNIFVVGSLPFLNGAGTGPGVGNRTRFQSTTNYAALAASATSQEKFWVVPTLVSNGSGQLTPTDDSNVIRNTVEQLANQFNFNPFDVLQQFGISFDTQKTRGPGDLDTQFFTGYYIRDDLYLEGEFGIRWPTGKRIETPNFVYLLPRGNDGHFQVEAGYMGWWHPIDWFALKNDAMFYGVLKRSERVAASFEGAQVANIGPTVEADVSWNYFTTHLDFTFFHPRNKGLGFDVGYEFYWKGNDHIKFLATDCCTSGTGCGTSCSTNACTFSNACTTSCSTGSGCCSSGVGSNCTPAVTSDGVTAPDFFGNIEPLDPCVLAMNTTRMSHKMRLEFFYHWDYGEIFAGWSQVVAGQSIMQETAWDLGMNIRF